MTSQPETPQRQWGTLAQLRKRYPILETTHPRTLARRERAGRFPRRSYLNPVTPIWPLDECDAWAADPAGWVDRTNSGRAA